MPAPIGAFFLWAASGPAFPTAPVDLAPRPRDARSRPPGTATRLYVNFDGAVLQTGCGNDPVGNCSTLAGLFDGFVGPFEGNEIQKMSIVQAVRKRLAPYAVDVTTHRPDAAVEYSMVLYGDLGEQSFAGIAPYIDCEDLHPRDTSFSQGFDTSNTGATIVLQEAAHTWGLEHVDGEGDIMHPFVVAGNTQVFEDTCHPIVSNTALDPAPGVCNVMHTRFCEAGHQNSHQELLYLFGPRTPDTTPPEIAVVEPADGSTLVAPTGDVPLIVTVHDDTEPQIYAVEIHRDDTLVLESDAGYLDRTFPVATLSDPPPGIYDLRIVLTDEAGNAGEATVTFEVVEAPSGADDADALPDAAFSEADGCRVSPRTPPWLLALLPPLFVRRKRR
ncbi:MAG: hypothetical protein D6705_18395 [Deltaproteobacteria bacterium]|nr:MAG: hypothetical protein D6705_18395 [Deltaproteobacteria bacterium]